VDAGPVVARHQLRFQYHFSINVTFTFKLKVGGKVVRGLETNFNGTAEEGYIRGKLIVSQLIKTFGKQPFSILVQRTDAKGRPYEIGPDGHTPA